MTISRKNLEFLLHPERRQLLPAPEKIEFPRECPSFSQVIFPQRISVLGCQGNTSSGGGADICAAERLWGLALEGQ